MRLLSLYLRNTIKPVHFRESLVETLKIGLVIKPLQLIHRKLLEKHTSELENCKEGTIGHEILQILKAHDLKVIPKFEDHDLKHLILGYGMSSIDEIKMQMYLLGNGNYSLSCILFASSGLLFPREWSNFYSEFKKGKHAVSILELSIQDCMTKQTQEVRAVYFNH